MTLQQVEAESLQGVNLGWELEGPQVYNPKGSPTRLLVVEQDDSRPQRTNYALEDPDVDWGTRSPSFAKTLRPHISNEAKSLLSNRVKDLLEPVGAILFTAANQVPIAITDIFYTAYKYPEEDSQEFQIEITAEANMSQTMALWQEVGRRIDAWKMHLNPGMRRTLSELGIQFYWTK